MKHLYAAICIALSSLTGMSWAGTPVEDVVACPVGGEKFAVKGTSSCSTMGRTMSFRPITSCDFITRLPICPGNGLPMYQEFSKDDVAKLEVFLETPDFERLKQLSPWQRAYGVAEHLGQTGSSTAFGVLLSSLWYEPEEFLGNGEILDKFLVEVNGEMARAPEEDKAFIDALVGYALLASGREKEAEVRLVRALKAGQGIEYLEKYISAIRECQPDMAKDGCRPLDTFAP